MTHPRSTVPVRPMPALPVGEFDSTPVRRARRQESQERAAARRRSWWYPFLVLSCLVALLFGLLQADQGLAARLIWTTQGAQFVPVADLPPEPPVVGPPLDAGTDARSDPQGPRLVVVAGGLNRRDGTSIAHALMPGLLTPGTQVVSLVYGNAIVDGDIEAKFDGLLERVRPTQVDFYGSSMGGDVVLNLAARLQQQIDVRRDELRNDRVESEESTSTTADPVPSLAVLTGVAAAGGTRAGQAAAQPASFGAAPSVDDDAPSVDGDAPSVDEPAPADPVDVPVDVMDLPPTPRIGTVYLDCTPLGTADVRAENRTRADTLTGVTEALHTDGGAGARLVAEVLAQRSQWTRPSNGPWTTAVEWDDLGFKIDQVIRDKISNSGISTGLIKDQYGVIRRMRAPEVLEALSPQTAIVYFLPENRAEDRTIDVARVEIALRAYRVELGLDVRIVPIPGGSHASAERTSQEYLAAMDRLNRPGTSAPATVITGLPD